MKPGSLKNPFNFDRLEKFFKSSFKMEGKVEYFNGSYYRISELLLVQNAPDAIKAAKLEMDVLAEKDVLMSSKRVYYNIIDPNKTIVHMYDSSLKDEHSN